MTDAIIKIIPGEYENPDAIENVIKYICRFEKAKPRPLFLYGAIYSPDLTKAYKNIILAFYDSRNTQVSPPDRKLWHFLISFPIPSQLITQNHFRFIDTVAQFFSSEYVNCYSYHTDTNNLHFHFAVSSTSYVPATPPLDSPKMNSYIFKIIQMASIYKISLTLEESVKNV